MQYIKKIKLEVKKEVKKVSSNKFLDAMFSETSKGKTENDAVTFTRSGSALLDFFAQAGAMRKNPEEALSLFKKAFAEDRLSAVRILFYLRDVRGGQGERDLFRTCLEWLGTDVPEVFEKIIGYVSEYGREDDYFFDNPKCFELIKEKLVNDLELAIEDLNSTEKKYYELIIQKLKIN